jgi:hypothetical protein
MECAVLQYGRMGVLMVDAGDRDTVIFPDQSTQPVVM